jgi:hypothetical protein
LQPALPGKHEMELELRFRKGQIRGEGRDWVGEFIVRGTYQIEDGRCWWTKRYVSKHDVAYQGYNEGRGIWGLWELTDPPWRGGFQIWPVGQGASGEAIAVSEEIGEPVLAGVLAADQFEDSFDRDDFGRIDLD